MFPSTLSVWGVLLLVSAIFAGITILILLNRWTSPVSVARNGVVIRLPSTLYWLAALPVMFCIILLAFALLILPFVIFALAGGGWPWALPGI